MASKTRYHHGDLTNALTVAATQLARDGGPEAVVLREAARQVGVSATAAYRHFAGHGDLMHAVKLSAQGTLADRMETVLAGTRGRDRGDTALRRVRAIGEAYIGFALAEPGLFRAAFCHIEDLPQADEPFDMTTVRSYQLLAGALDELAAAGLMNAARRPYAEIAAWSAVHGLAVLFLDGPLAGLPDAVREEAIDRALDAIVAGLCAPVG